MASTRTGHFVSDTLFFEYALEGINNLFIMLEAQQFPVVVKFSVDPMTQLSKDKRCAVFKFQAHCVQIRYNQPLAKFMNVRLLLELNHQAKGGSEAKTPTPIVIVFITRDFPVQFCDQR